MRAAVPRKRMLSPTSQSVDYFHAVAGGECVCAVPSARDDFAVDFHRHATLAKAFGLQQLQHGGLRRDSARLAVQNDVHSCIVAASVGPGQSARFLTQCGVSASTPHASISHPRAYVPGISFHRKQDLR